MYSLHKERIQKKLTESPATPSVLKLLNHFPKNHLAQKVNPSPSASKNSVSLRWKTISTAVKQHP